MLREIYSEYTNQVEPYGCDEAWLDVTNSSLLKGDGRKIAEEINRRVKKELGITVSIGISWNKIFAKLGSDYKKPVWTVRSHTTYRFFMMANFLSMRSLHETVPTILLFLILNLEILLNPALNLPERSTV